MGFRSLSDFGERFMKLRFGVRPHPLQQMSRKGALVLDKEPPAEEDVTVTRRDLRDNEWEVATLARQNGSMAGIITAEWGLGPQKARFSYVYCKCVRQPRCGMVVKYTRSGQDVRRESKNEHVAWAASVPSSAATACLIVFGTVSPPVPSPEKNNKKERKPVFLS